MADEISIRISTTLQNGQLADRFDSGSLTFDQLTQRASIDVVSVGTSEEDYTLPTDMTTPGYIMLRNLDTTNYVQYGPKDTTMKVLGRLDAGAVALFKLDSASVTLRWVANTAACLVEIHVWEL